MTTNMIEQILKRDRTIVLSGLVIIVGLAWVYTIYLVRVMAAMDMMDMPMEGGPRMAMPTQMVTMPNLHIWSSIDFLIVFGMWAVMMVGMMSPSAAPTILTYAGILRKQQRGQHPFWPTALFLCGYLVMWTLYSALATVVQWGLQATALLSPMMVSATPLFGGTLLIAIGLFQFTPLKQACLAHCRTPLSFFMTNWRDGAWGAFRMGVSHGNYCVGCCWLLMVLLFVTGIMNLLWMALLTVYVLAEKVVPGGRWLSYSFGLFCIGWGIMLFGG